jgi:hypothetical protein
MRATLDRGIERDGAFGRDGAVVAAVCDDVTAAGERGAAAEGAATGDGEAGGWVGRGGVTDRLAFMRVTDGDAMPSSVLVPECAGAPFVAGAGAVVRSGSA